MPVIKAGQPAPATLPRLLPSVERQADTRAAVAQPLFAATCASAERKHGLACVSSPCSRSATATAASPASGMPLSLAPRLRSVPPAARAPLSPAASTPDAVAGADSGPRCASAVTSADSASRREYMLRSSPATLPSSGEPCERMGAVQPHSCHGTGRPTCAVVVTRPGPGQPNARLASGMGRLQACGGVTRQAAHRAVALAQLRHVRCQLLQRGAHLRAHVRAHVALNPLQSSRTCAPLCYRVRCTAVTNPSCACRRAFARPQAARQAVVCPHPLPCTPCPPRRGSPCAAPAQTPRSPPAGPPTGSPSTRPCPPLFARAWQALQEAPCPSPSTETQPSRRARVTSLSCAHLRHSLDAVLRADDVLQPG
jgi:hypothetical protein